MSNEDIIRHLIMIMGDDPEREGLEDTPRRVLKSYKELFSGYDDDPKEILSKRFLLEDAEYKQIIMVKDIHFTSFCEHHLLPFSGIAHVGYMPKTGSSVVGLSKIARVVACYAKRLQIQERLTDQIASCIFDELNPAGVGVYITAHHSCMGIRGAHQPNGKMITCSLKGNFLQPDLKSEFHHLIG